MGVASPTWTVRRNLPSVTVTAGTFTLTMPTNDATHALIQLA